MCTYKTIGYGLMFLLSGVVLLLNALSPEGFFPSGHGTGRFSEVISGAILGFAGVMILVSRRRRNEDKARDLNS